MKHVAAGFAFLVGASVLAGQESAFDERILRELDREIEQSIRYKRLPGGVLHLEHRGVDYTKAYGKRATWPSAEAMTEDTVFDAASLTKVVATLPGILKLIERGSIRLDDPVHMHLPEFRGDANKERVTVRNLLTHTSGLLPGIRLGYEWESYENGIALACGEESKADCGSEYRYSDINFILLGEIVRRVSGETLDVFAAKHIFQPLGMFDTGFRPPERGKARIAPTTKEADGELLRGTVHDPTARKMGGVAGHAGLFTTAENLSRYARMILGKGVFEGKTILEEESVRLMTSVQSPSWIAEKRGLGWDIDSPHSSPRGERFPVGSFGHTGWTGASLWIDPYSGTFVIFLSNRNHPHGRGSVVSLRRKIGTLAARAVRGFDFSSVKKMEMSVAAPIGDFAKQQLFRRKRGSVLNGIDVLARDDFSALEGMKVGLITNHTGISRAGDTTIDLFHKSKKVKLMALFSPEHGIRGTEDSSVKSGVDRKTGIKIHSLYAGKTRKPLPAQLEGLDALVFDIQDIGCRFYTYISTMGNCMEAAQEAGIKFVVLDRVNPVGGVAVQGPVLDGARTFTGFHEIPVRHGMTVGELAKMFRAERFPKVDLTVVPVEGWKRDMPFDKTGLPWVNPSPNMRNLTEAILYPGVGLLEFTNLSVGRGTRQPFEFVGAPYIDPNAFAQELERANLPGLKFVPIRYTPDASVFKGEKCGGVRILLKDPDKCPSVDLGIVLAKALRKLYPGKWETKNLNKLLVHPATRDGILNGDSLKLIRRSWEPEMSAFKKKRAGYLIYL